MSNPAKLSLNKFSLFGYKKVVNHSDHNWQQKLGLC